MSLRVVVSAVLSCALACMFIVLPADAAVSPPLLINYPDFADPNEISFVGNATATATVARLTDGDFHEAGALWGHRTVDSSQDWHTTFRLQLAPSSGRADGAAFVLQDSGLAAIGDTGGEIGYGGIEPSVAVEFDIYANEWDVDDNHIAITTNGIVSQPAAVGEPGFDLADDSFRAWISYDSASHRMKVYVSRDDDQPQTPVVEAGINAPATFPSRLMFAGFTAATGAETAVQDVQSWSLSGWAAHALFGGSPIDFRSGSGEPPGEPAPKGACTAGFAVMKNGTRYMLTASHCRDPLPTIRVYPGDNRTAPYLAFADCTGANAACLVAPPKAKPSDMLAWKPDSVRLQNLVQTGRGLLPVLGSADWKKGQWVCRWGRSTGFEVCGNIKGFDGKSKYVVMHGAAAEHGDSGGPVYAYVRDPDGSVTGVTAIGITEDSAIDCNKKCGDLNETRFLPIATAMETLGITVLGP